MHERTAALAELISYYRAQGVPEDQQMLIAMLREAQEIDGGALTDATLAHIAQAYSLKEAVACCWADLYGYVHGGCDRYSRRSGRRRSDDHRWGFDLCPYGRSSGDHSL